MSQTSIKLALVSATSVSMTDTSGKEGVKVPCIHYPIQFQEDEGQGGQE